MFRSTKARRSMVALWLVVAVALVGTGTAIALNGKEPSAPGKATQGTAGRKYVTKTAPAEDGSPYIAKCPKGTHVVGGGAGADNGGADVNESRPWDSNDKGDVPDDGWATYFNDTSSAADVRVYAICE
jgi:hypothetical protein